MKFSNKIVAAALALSVATITIPAFNKNANAAIGAGTGNVALAIAGGVVMGAGVGTLLVGLPITCAVSARGANVPMNTWESPCNEMKDVAAIAVGTSAGFTTILGIVLLDGANQGLRFERLTTAQAQKLGLSDEELKAYSKNRAKFNRIAEDIASLMIDSGNVSSKLAKSVWDSYRTSIDPASFSALEKIISQK